MTSASPLAAFTSCGNENMIFFPEPKYISPSDRKISLVASLLSGAVSLFPLVKVTFYLLAHIPVTFVFMDIVTISQKLWEKHEIYTNNYVYTVVCEGDAISSYI
jgi:hypothetical protein